MRMSWGQFSALLGLEKAKKRGKAMVPAWATGAHAAVVRELVRAGWAEEVVKGNYRITQAGEAAMEQWRGMAK